MARLSPIPVVKRLLALFGRVVRAVAKGVALVAVALFVVWGVANGLWMIVPRSPDPPISVPDGSFAFGALGDAPYNAVEFELFDVILEDLGQHELASVLHVGDIFSEPCRDDAYRRTRDVFDGLPHPVVYTPGDNEWTDCYDGSPESTPYERLASIRRVLFDDATTSLGGRPIPLEHQGDDPARGEFPEHARWTHEGIVFATVHLVGSANAMRPFPGRTEADAGEPRRRTRAAAEWLRETFTVAREMDATAVVLAWHAHPFFEAGTDALRRRPFEPFLQALEEEVAAWGRPVLGIHGDFHRYLVDRPLVDRTTGRTLENFTRVQVPGSPSVGWVHVTVTPDSDDLFRFESRVESRWPW